MALLAVLTFATLCIGLSSAGVGFDFLVFAQEWPPTYCMSSSNIHCDFPYDIVKGWNIHGLWPSVYHGNNPANCKNGSSFNYDALKPIFETLQDNWANLKGYFAPRKFWKHEWDKHGRCAIGDSVLNSELNYFNVSLNLKFFFSVDKALKKYNIIPNATQPYKTADVVAALQNATGVRPVLCCIGKKGKPYEYWMETRFCLGEKLNPINCTNGMAGSSFHSSVQGKDVDTNPCKDTILYPPFNHTIAARRRPSLLTWLIANFGDRL